MTGSWLSRIEQNLWPDGFRRNVWMVVDAARDPQILPLMRALHLESYCLYAGSLPQRLESVAPHMLQLDYEDADTRRFLKHAWGNSWGVFLKCGKHANTLKKHLRRFLMVRDPAGQRMVFRYYDPRVLRIYLPTCVEDELRTLFGPIEGFWMEAASSPGEMLQFRLMKGRLDQSTLSLQGNVAPRGVSSEADDEEEPSSDDAVLHHGLLTIRQEQIQAFVQYEIQKFEDRVAAHVRKSFPAKFDALGEGRTRQVIRHGIRMAERYDITAQRDVCKYIDLMFTFGVTFDQDVRLSWPRAILTEPALKDSASKMDRLFAAAKEHVQRGARNG